MQRASQLKDLSLVFFGQKLTDALTQEGQEPGKGGSAGVLISSHWPQPLAAAQHFPSKYIFNI